MAGAVALPGRAARPAALALLAVTDVLAAALLAADLVVVIGSVILRSLFNAPVEWSDDVARGLMVGSSFFGAASALARGENAGRGVLRRPDAGGREARLEAAGALLVVLVSAYVAWNALKLGWLTTGQTDRIRPAAGVDVLPDGGRRGLHGAVRGSTVVLRRPAGRSRPASLGCWARPPSRSPGRRSRRTRCRAPAR